MKALRHYLLALLPHFPATTGGHSHLLRQEIPNYMATASNTSLPPTYYLSWKNPLQRILSSTRNIETFKHHRQNGRSSGLRTSKTPPSTLKPSQVHIRTIAIILLSTLLTPSPSLLTPSIQIQQILQSIGNCLIRIVDSIGAILAAIVRGFANVFRIIISGLTCGNAGGKRTRRETPYHESGI